MLIVDIIKLLCVAVRSKPQRVTPQLVLPGSTEFVTIESGLGWPEQLISKPSLAMPILNRTAEMCPTLTKSSSCELCQPAAERH